MKWLKFNECIWDGDKRVWITWTDYDLSLYVAWDFDRHIDIPKMIEGIKTKGFDYDKYQRE